MLISASVAGCASSYCVVAEPPFYWTEDELKVTPERPKARIVRDSEKYYRICM